MPPKRRLSSVGSHDPIPAPKRIRTGQPLDHLSDLSDELLIRILHHLPIESLLKCQRLSRRFCTLAGDSQIWKNLYYNRFVLPRALRIPGIKATAAAEEALHFASRRSKWLDEDTLVNRVDGKTTYWKGQYKLRHNWSIGACEVQEIHVADRPSTPSMLAKLVDGVVVTADKEEGLRAWDLKGKGLITKCDLDGCDPPTSVPTSLAVDEQESAGGLGITVGFMDGGWGIWRLDLVNRTFVQEYKHPSSSNGTLSAVAYAHPYVLSITDAQLLSLYTLASPEKADEDLRPSSTLEDKTQSRTDILDEEPASNSSDAPSLGPPFQPHLLASLKSHTSWPPLSLLIRTTSTSIIASIAYSLPTYLSSYTIGVQELHLSLSGNTVISSRIASALPQGFHSVHPTSPSSNTSSPSTPTRSTQRSGINSRPTSLSYSHPYILATHPDNTLTLYLCNSTATSLSISPGTKLWGHTSSVSSAEITPRGKAVSVSTRGHELRVWELEGGFSSPKISSRKRSSRNNSLERSVQVRAEAKSDPSKGHVGDGDGGGEGLWTERKQWVGFDDEVVIVLKESGKGTQALMIYDFT